MVVSLYVIGVLVTAIGFVTIGFGIPNYAFSHGTMLILAGTTAAVGGLILIGLAAGVAQLKRIAEGARPRPARSADSAETAMAPATRVPPRAPAPPRPVEADMPHPAEARSMAEPRFPVTEPSDTPTGPLDWLRPKGKGSSEGQGPAPVVDVPDEAPLSPRTPSRPAMTPLTTMSDPVLEPKAWSPSRNGGSEPKAEARPLPRSERVARATPAERPRQNGMFDTVWPEAKSPQPMHDAPEPKSEAPVEPAHEEPAASHEPPASERPVAILKSGVIDGMAYTLYADGSIEAELAQGTVRFASVDALRAHLEKSE